MSRSRGRLHLARICPWCGTATLVRDRFTGEGYREKGASFLCTVCHTGFQLSNSPRVQFAERMFQMDRAQRPPENEHRTFVQCKPLTERSMFELQRIEGVLKSKRPATKSSKEHNARCLSAVQGEIRRRGMRSSTLTYTIGEIFPPGCLPEPYAQIDNESDCRGVAQPV